MKNITGTLGLARKARALYIGETRVYEAIADLKLLILAHDVGVATKRKVEQKAFHYQIPILQSLSRDELSQAIGTTNTVVIGLKDPGFIHLILKEDQHG
jgi:ribosomal protein L7Ae-like RNA K-turn-binding protein